MKKRICLLVLLLSLFVTNVYAKDTYYTNKNGVSFTKEEYDFLDFMFWNGSQDLMTPNDYAKFISSNIMQGELKQNVYSEPTPYATVVDTAKKNLKITSTCSSDCLISVVLTWKSVPNVKSYDVMGFYLDNTRLVNAPTTRLITQSETIRPNDIKHFANGLGVSMKLPDNGTSFVANQTYRVAKGGTVYASYQHATKNISLANSQNYNLSRTGFGGVFGFSGVATSTYDNMQGVSLSL